VVAIAKELKIPILYIGVGEGQEDLIPFSAEGFVDSLGLGEDD
jgi:fused signal recognition particle receptor